MFVLLKPFSEIFEKLTSSMYSSYFRNIAARPGDNGDDDDCIGDDDYYKIFIANHRFRYSLLARILLELEVKKAYS